MKGHTHTHTQRERERAMGNTYSTSDTFFSDSRTDPTLSNCSTYLDAEGNRQQSCRRFTCVKLKTHDGFPDNPLFVAANNSAFADTHEVTTISCAELGEQATTRIAQMRSEGKIVDATKPGEPAGSTYEYLPEVVLGVSTT
jgi:hypothetical protein